MGEREREREVMEAASAYKFKHKVKNSSIYLVQWLFFGLQDGEKNEDIMGEKEAYQGDLR